MKRILFLLAILIGLVRCAVAETVEPEFVMWLSQEVVTGPMDVTVTIEVTNPYEQDMPGPLALYWPNGKIIEEFGMPTLKAGESLTWRGTWNVTDEQLDAGKVIFAIRYTVRHEDGSIGTNTQSYYVPIHLPETAPYNVILWLESNPSTGYVWSWEADPSGKLFVREEYVYDWQPENEDDFMPPGTGGRTRITLIGRQPGLTLLTLNYKRHWEEESLYSLYYVVDIDKDLNVTIIESGFDW